MFRGLKDEEEMVRELMEAQKNIQECAVPWVVC